jgi:hypothetical protein
MGEADQDGVCTGPCRLGSPCGNDPALRCVPYETGLRRGDFGFCERGCTTSADCIPGLTACAPTGFLAAPGQPERTCAYTLSVPSTLNQRLSVEELALPSTPAGLLGIQAYTPGGTLFHLGATSDGVCVTGTLASNSPVVLVFQFGSNDPVPFDASAFQAFIIEHDSQQTVLMQAQLSNQPGKFYRNEIVEGVSYALPPTSSVIPFAEMAPLVAGAPRWDPAQLEAVLVVVGDNDPPGPFEMCVQNLGFE